MGQISQYAPNCGYSYDKLDTIIYLLPSNSLKKIYIDNGEAYISGLTGTPLVLHGYDISFNEESSSDERYKFQKSLTFSLHGYANRSTLEGNYYAVIKSKDGTKWMVNVDFPSVIKYDFKLDGSQYGTTFTFTSLSNFPTLRLATELPKGLIICKQLHISGIDSLKLLNNNLTRLDYNNKVLYVQSGSSFLDVDFLGKSASIQEQYDGEIVTTTITFNISFDAYKSSWHYNLLEFASNNYCSIIKPKDNDNIFFSGFNHGLQPSYKIEATSTNSNSDIITVTLTEKSLHGSVASSEYEEEEDTSTRWLYVNNLYGAPVYECYGDSLAMYILKKEVDAYGVETGNYMCYSGTSSQFTELNIVGEFTEIKTFSEPTCRADGCKLTTTIPNTITFYGVDCDIYEISGSCPWHVVSIPDTLFVNPLSGEANYNYAIQLCNTTAPTSSGVSGTLGIAIGDDTEPSKLITINVLQERGVAWENPQYVNCLKQNVVFGIKPNCSISFISQWPDGVTCQIQGSQLIVSIPRNESTADTKTYIIGLRNCTGKYGNATIYQDKTYERWMDTSDYICESGSSYVKQQRYTGTTATNINTPTLEYRKGSLITIADFNKCGSITRWTWNDKYICENGNKFKVDEEEIFSGTTWVKSGVSRLGEMVESASSFCQETVEYKWVLSSQWECESCGIQTRTISATTPYCYLYDKYLDVYEQISDDCGVTWYTNSTIPTVIEVNSSDCGYVPYLSQYLSFVATESGTFKFNGNSISYSLDSGTTWTTLASNTDSPTVSANSKIMWKANLTPTRNGIGHFTSSGHFTAEGNVMSLLYGDDFFKKLDLSGKNYAFAELFYDCNKLTNAENLMLPATTLSNYCYQNMFEYCSSLTTAPSLPATTLAVGCYSNMFLFCTSLTTAPQLPATTLAMNCYDAMFQGCTSLTTAPQLLALNLAINCYREMFVDCSGLTTVHVLPSTSLVESCYERMFYGCTSLTTVPSDMLPALNLANSCYRDMFDGCTSLTTAPILSAPTLARLCYSGMFNECSNLNAITCLATDISAEECTDYWVSYVAESGTFTKASSMNDWTSGDNGIPSGWTVVDAA